MKTQRRQTSLDPITLREWLTQTDQPRIIDVRIPVEFEAAHILGSYNVPLHLLREHTEEIASHLDEEITGSVVGRLRS